MQTAAPYVGVDVHRFGVLRMLPLKQSEERRRERRHQLGHVAVITFAPDEQHYCLVRDFSDGGVRLHVKGFEAPDDFSLRFAPGAPARSGDYKVAWRDGQDLGAKFVGAP